MAVAVTGDIYLWGISPSERCRQDSLTRSVKTFSHGPGLYRHATAVLEV